VTPIVCCGAPGGMGRPPVPLKVMGCAVLIIAQQQGNRKSVFLIIDLIVSLQLQVQKASVSAVVCITKFPGAEPAGVHT